ncbi:MAG: hypothetical protein WC476_01635 [Phycisphaerae bacterium]|jgi:hypothetical protein
MQIHLRKECDWCPILISGDCEYCHGTGYVDKWMDINDFLQKLVLKHSEYDDGIIRIEIKWKDWV